MAILLNEAKEDIVYLFIYLFILFFFYYLFLFIFYFLLWRPFCSTKRNLLSNFEEHFCKWA